MFHLCPTVFANCVRPDFLMILQNKFYVSLDIFVAQVFDMFINYEISVKLGKIFEI